MQRVRDNFCSNIYDHDMHSHGLISNSLHLFINGMLRVGAKNLHVAMCRTEMKGEGQFLYIAI